VFDKKETLVPGQVFDVSGFAGNKIIHGNNGVAFGQKTITQMRTEKAGATGN
jgi:hypothetical protein